MPLPPLTLMRVSLARLARRLMRRRLSHRPTWLVLQIAAAGWRSTVYLTADYAVLERWTGSDLEYRALPRSAALDAQLRARYPGLEAIR
jgi:hypothetical protein